MSPAVADCYRAPLWWRYYAGKFNVPTHDNSDVFVFTEVTRVKISVLYNDFYSHAQPHIRRTEM